MSPAVTGPGPFLCRRSSALSRECMRSATGCTFTTRGLRNSLTEPCIAVSPCRLTHDRRKRKVGPPYMGAAGTRCKWTRLLRIQLDDQVLIDVGQDVVPARRRLEQATE